MARFFNPSQQPLQFGDPTPVHAVHIDMGTHTTSDPDAPKKRALVKKAYNDSIVDKSSVTEDAPSGEDGAPADGMRVNTYTGEKVQDPQRYYENLRKVGLGDFAAAQEEKAIDLQKKKTDLEKEQIVLQNQHTDLILNHVSKSLEVAASGNTDLALQIANQVHPKGTRITSITPVDKGRENFLVKSEDNPEGEIINRAAAARAMAGAKERMDAFFPAKWDMKTGVLTQDHMLTGETKHIATISAETLKDGKPVELASDEVALADGRRLKTTTILDAYKATYQHLLQYTDDPKAMLLLESTDPAKAAAVRAKSANIPSPIEWAKDPQVFGVDITGKIPSSNTRPASEVGGRTGAITPTGKGWMDSQPKAEDHKGYTIEDNKGKKYRSDGTTWLPLDEFNKKYPTPKGKK